MPSALCRVLNRTPSPSLQLHVLYPAHCAALQVCWTSQEGHSVFCINFILSVALYFLSSLRIDQRWSWIYRTLWTLNILLVFPPNKVPGFDSHGQLQAHITAYFNPIRCLWNHVRPSSKFSWTFNHQVICGLQPRLVQCTSGLNKVERLREKLFTLCTCMHSFVPILFPFFQFSSICINFQPELILTSRSKC